MRKLARYAPVLFGVLSFVFIFIVWEMTSRLQLINPFFISSPTEIFKVLHEQIISGELFENIGVSFTEFAIGYGLAIIIGVFLGLLMGWYKVVDYALDPFVWTLYSAPIIAFYPILVLILGLGKPTVIAITFKLAVVLVLVNTASGIKNVDPLLLRVARSFGAQNFELFFKVALPASVPMMIAGFRLGVGRALMGVVAAELFGSTRGLGAAISYYGGLLETSKMLASLIVVSALGVLMTQALSAVEAHFDSWRTGPET